MTLYHGGLAGPIDLDRAGDQQNRRGRTYGGFYLADESSRDWATSYARQRNGLVAHFEIVPGARVLETSRNIDRLSLDERHALALDWDLIRGVDTLGRSQYVLLQLDAITHTTTEEIR